MNNAALSEVTLPSLSGGLNTHDPESGVADNQSPDMLNLWFRDMALCKRPGRMRQIKLNDVRRISEPYNGSCVVHAGTKLYRWDEAGAVRYRGVYEAGQVYEAGDYVFAGGTVTIGGATYQTGDCVIYNVTAESPDTPVWHNPVTDVDALYRRGTFDPNAGYPAAASPGEYYTASADGTADGIAYKTGDRAVFVENALRLSITGIATETKASLPVTVTAAGVTGSPISLTVTVDAGDSGETVVADRIRAAIVGNAALSAVYMAGGSYGALTLTQINAGDMDTTLDMTIGSCAGLTVEKTNVMWRRVGRLNDKAGVFCEFGDTLYYMDGAEIWQVNPDYSYWPVEPYEPVVLINARPDLSESDDGEAYNLLGGGFTVKYNGDGIATQYFLPQISLDGMAVKVTVGIAEEPYTKELTEGIDFNVSRGIGRVLFTAGADPYGAPMAGTNNVWITAYKTVSGGREKIAGCTVATRFGGESTGVVGGTRVFVMGNPDYPYHFWRSDLGLHVAAGMTYFPDTSEEVLDQNSDAITAAAKMGESLIIFKENSIFAVSYEFDGQDVYYPVRECHSAIGCDMPGSVQLIDNRLVFAHSRTGVHILIGTDNSLETLVKPLSANVNSLLLAEEGLMDAGSCDYGRYYWLCAGGYVYLWDYDTTPYYNYSDYDKAQKRLAWYRFGGIGASALYASATALYHTDGEGIVRFMRSHNDFGQAFGAYFKSKAFDLGSPDELKTFVALYPGFSTDGNIKVTVTAANDKTDSYMTKEINVRSFDWSKFSWDAFAWHRIKFEKVFRMRLNMRRAAFLQVNVEGGELDHGVGLSSLRITYFRNRKV